MERLNDTRDLAWAADRLIEAEPRFGLIVAAHGLPTLRPSPPGLESLLRIVTDQLISLRAGEAIWRRLASGLGGFTPEAVLACPEDHLRGLGLSAAKARCFQAAARAFAEGHFDAPDELSETEIFRRLTAIRGVGPWTANLYLLTALKAADAWPAQDLALQEAARHLLGMPVRPTPREMERMACAWQPYRSAAALLLWSHYRGLKGLRQA
ncbi:DNA-3-methyladenine glycosylase family protein [Aestuariivirga sp.]|uniref:DNA-3-methyladenine glycosylase family protein n=1 Tax=Aestuariivirga sp. TaxID=2650926 RepID=UPI00391D90D5